MKQAEGENLMKKSTKDTEKIKNEKKKKTSKKTINENKNEEKITNKIGRKPTIKEKAPLIIESLRIGNTNRGAAYSAGVCQDTFYRWLSQGQKDKEDGFETDFSEFYDGVNAAIEAAKSYALECWRKHMPDDWRAAMSYLERRDRDNYAPKQVLDVAQTVEVSQKAFLEIPDNKRRVKEATEDGGSSQA